MRMITARSELRKVLFFLALNGFAPNSQGRRVWSLARTSLKVKVNFGGMRTVYAWKNIYALVSVFSYTRSMSIA